MTMRSLASVQKIWKISPIEGADAIELVHILGWQCVAKKDEFKAGDNCIYFEIDSFLPILEEFEFLRKSSYRKSDFLGEGFRIKSMRFKGVLSQGLALPMSIFPEIPADIQLKTDLTKKLGVKKWELPEIEGSSGTITGDKPFGIPTTDETRVQSLDSLRTELLGKPYYISTKMDGTSCTMYVMNGQFGVCGRNKEYKDDDNCSIWKYAHEHDISEKLKRNGRNLALQGEFCGHGIQKNRLKLLKPEWYIFDIFDLEMRRYLNFEEMLEITKTLGLITVPVEEIGDSFNYTLGELIDRALGKYPSGMHKEGIVVRPQIYGYVCEAQNRLSFKVLNNDFLLSEK